MKEGEKRLSSLDRGDNPRESLRGENGNVEVRKDAIQKSQAVKLAADRLLFVWSFFCSSSWVKGIGLWGFTLSLRWF